MLTQEQLSIRHRRALQIADRFRIVAKNGKWMVPSQTSLSKYAVALNDGESRCTCPDHESHRDKCKHILAVEYVLQRDRNVDGSTTVTETVRFTASARQTYPQNWPAYNEAQTNEKDRFQVLLSDLCSGVATPEQTGRGRRTLNFGASQE